jgi:hypothetical protein
MLLYENEKACAVYFFGREGIVREMLHSEFEALLDGVVTAADWADSEARAAFVEIDANLCVTAAVFFRVSFDRQGAVLPSWRLPLHDLVKHSAKGPDLGAGPINLACASHCPIAYYASDLWNPDMRPASSHFVQLKKAVKRNRLGLDFRPGADGGGQKSAGADAQVAQLFEQKLSQQLRRQYEKDFRDHMAKLLKEQRLRLSTLNADKEEAIAQLKREHNQRVAKLRKVLEDKERALTEAEARNTQLKQTIEGQAQKIQGLREYFEHKLEKVQGEEAQHVSELKKNYELEVEAKVAAATTELKESLQMRDVELYYRNEQESQLREEIARLRRETSEIVNNSGDQLLEKLQQKGVNFVSYQPGAGHLTIPLSHLSQFTENPQAYVAEQCGVSLLHYQAWLNHYQAPVCQALTASGQACNANVVRVPSPADFHPGETNFCEKCRQLHQSAPLQSVRG